MATSLEDIDQLQVLEAQREVDYEQAIEDLFCNESTGLHVFFQRTPNNQGFISEIIKFEHELERSRIFEACRDQEEGFVDGQKVIDGLMVLFRSMGDVVAVQDQSVFDEAHLTKAEFMSHIQRAFGKIAKMFEDSQFPAETYFLESLPAQHIVHSGSQPKTKSLPPSSVMDIQPRVDFGSRTAMDKAPLSERKDREGKIITLSFDRAAAIHSMLRDVGMSVTLEHFHEEDFVRATMPEILRVADLALRRTSKSIIRRTKPRDLNDLIDKTTQEIIMSIQNQATDNSDMLVSRIIFFFYSPGREHLRNDLEKKIREEVADYFKKIHVTPATIAPPRTVTKIPSYRPRVPSQPPVPQVVVRSEEIPTGEIPDSMRRSKTERPMDFRRDTDVVAQETKALVDSISTSASAVVATDHAANDGGAADLDDEPTQVDLAPAAVPSAPAVPTATSLLAASIPVEKKLEDLQGSMDDEVTSVEAPSEELIKKSVPPSAMQEPAPEVHPPQPAAPPKLHDDQEEKKNQTDTFLVPENLRPFRGAPDRPAAPVSVTRIHTNPPPAPVVQPVERSVMEVAPEKLQPINTPPSQRAQTPPQQTPPELPKKSGFFSRAKKWIVGGAMAAAAALGVYAVTQTKTGPGEEPAPVASTATVPNNTPAPSATAAETPVQQPKTAKVSSTAEPPVSTPPDAQQETPKVTEVLGKHSYALGSASGAAPFVGKASMVEGGVDATPFAPVQKTAAWYENKKKSAEILLEIYDKNQLRLDQEAINFVKAHETMLRDLAGQSNFNPVVFKGSFENKYAAPELLGANGLYNNLLALERILDLYGGDREKLGKDSTKIKLSIGSRVMAPEQRFAKAFLFKDVPGGNPAPNQSVPQKNPQDQDGKHIDSVPQPSPTGSTGFNQFAPDRHDGLFRNTLPTGFFDDLKEAYASHVPVKTLQDLELEEVDAAWDNITVAQDKDALAHDDTPDIEAQYAELEDSDLIEIEDDAPDIAVKDEEIHPAELVELDRREALLERGEIVVPPVEEGGTGSVLMALENGFIRECRSGDQMDRVQQRIAKIRMSSLQEYEVLTDGKIYAKITDHDLTDLRQIVSNFS
jgi:hypothetical protein